MLPSSLNALRIGVVSVVPNLRAEIVRILPSLESQLTDLLQQDGESETCKKILEGNEDEASLGRIASSLIKDSNILVGDMDLIGPIMHHLDGVRWVQSTFAGVDAVVASIKEQNHPKFTLTRFAGTFGQHMAEYVIGHIVAQERNFKRIYQSQALSFWDAEVHVAPYRLLNELSISILGLGDIGRCVAKICKAFGMTVHGVVSKEIRDSERLSCVDKYYFSLDHLPEILKHSDYVCNTLPKTAQTDNIMSNGVLKHCQNRKSVLVNIGRGNILTEDDIVCAFENGWIGGAILDVFQNEPLPATSKLWNLPNVIITPHCSGLSFAPDVAKVFLKNLNLFQKGRPMNNVVDWQKGY